MEKTFTVKKSHNCLIIPLAGNPNEVKIYNSRDELIRHSRTPGVTEIQQTVEPGTYRVECDGTIKDVRSTAVDFETIARQILTEEPVEAVERLIMAAPEKAAFIRAGTINKDTTIRVKVNFTISDINRVRIVEVAPVTEGVPMSWNYQVSRTGDTMLQYSFGITNHSKDTSAEYEIKILEI